MKLHLPVKLRASLLAAVIAVPALLYGKAFAGTSYVAPSNEFGWDTNDITLNQRYNQTAGNTYTATQHSYDVFEMYGDGVNAKVRVGYTDETYATKLVYQGGQYGTVSDGVFTPYTGEVYFNKTGHKDDTASIIVKAEAPDQASGKHTSYMDGGGTFTSEEMVFENSLKSGSDTGSEYKDGASIVTDAIKVNNGYKEGSVVVLEDVNVETKTEGATMQTALQSDTQLVILNGNDNGNAKLTDDEKDTLNIVNVENNNAYDNNTVRTVELGEVKGVSDDEASPNKKGGSLVIVGNKERTEATKNEQGAITQGAFVDAYVKDDHVDVQITSVDNLAELSAANANLSIEEDVNNVNTTTLVNSVTTVGGSLSSLGIKVNGESTLTAKGDIKNIIGQGATSTQIDGQVISKEGEISLTNGSVNEGAIVRAESASQGDVTLSNIESEMAAEISAGHDLTLKDNSKIDSTQKISIGHNLTVDDSSLTGYEDKLTVPGDMSVQNGGLVDTVKDLDVGGGLKITGSDVEGNHSTVTNVGNGEDAVGHVTGNVTVEEGGILSNSTLGDVDGNIIVDDATLTSSTINADGYLLAKNGAILSKGDVVGEDGEISSRDNVLTVAQDSVITSGSQVSGTDLTVTSETGDPNLEISGQKDGHATTVTGDTNLTVDGAVKVDDGAELSLDGGEASDASLTANQLELRDIAADRASISNGTVGVESQTLIQSGNTFALSNTSGGLGTVKEVGDDSSTVDSSVAVPGTTLDISNGSGITAAEIITESTGQTPPVTIHESKELFDKVVVRGDSTLNVEGLAAINEYVQGSDAKESAGEDVQGSTTTIEGDAWLKDVAITGTGAYDAEQGTETTLKSDAHIGSLTIANEGALSFVGADNDNKTESYIARLTQTSDGHINVVNSVLTTPELHGENISLGLNGGTVVLGQVEAQDGATVGSVDQTNAHVLVGEITNASATGAPDQSPYTSTIRTTVDRVTSEYSFSKGDPSTATVKTYVFIARKDGTVTVNGQEITVVAGQEVEIADTYLNEATEYPGEESVSTGVTTVDMAEFIADNQDLLDPKLVGVVDGDGNPVCDKDGHQLMAQVIEKGEDLTYYPDAQQSLGTLTEVSDGIASLTVKGDFDADNTLINAYLTGAADENGHVIADADSGLITIEGVLSGQDNTLNADVDVSIGGIVSKDGAAYEAANKVTALKGDIAIGEEGIVGSSNVLSATNGKITVTGAIEGNSNDLDAKLNIETGSITGDDNMLTSETGSITTGAITGDGNMLTSEEGAIATGAIDGDSNDLDAKLNIVTGSITGDSNMLTSTEGSITTGAIVGDSNILDANGDITVDGSITGDSNVLDSEEGAITTGAIVGNSNDLDAVDSITVNGDIDGSANDLDATGNITVHGSIITGGLNEETGNKLTSTEGSITVDNGISGDFNNLDAKLDITTGPISGNSNTLTSLDDSITVNGDISGNSNVLDAKLDITTGSISGSSNTLTSSDASITVKGDISGDSNNLNAKLDIEAGDVSGDENVLIAGNEIRVEAVSGSDNDLTAGKDLMVETDIIGDGNDLTSVDGGVYIDGQLTGNTNQVKGETIEVGSVTGTNQKVLSYGDGLSPDDVAIHIGEFNAQGSTVAIATEKDPVMGQASGNGAIVIDSMTSVGEGLNTGMQNTISSNISSVYIGSLNDYDAYTLIEAHDDIVVGSLVGTHGVRSEGDKAFNQTWKAENLIVNSANGLTLVNSVLTMTGSISGGDLTLELEQPADGTIYVTTSSANSVTLNSLTLVNGAQLRVLGKADIESLTLDGKYSALDATTTEITELTLANGASYNAGLVIVDTLNIDNSSMSVVTLAGVKEISLVDNAVLAITGVDGKTDLTGDLSVDENSKLLVTFDLKTKGSITSSNGSLIQAANITAGDGLVSDGGTIKTTSGDIIAESGAIAATQGGTIEAVGNITAEDGNITADNGTIYTTGKISAEKGNLIASNGSELTAGKGLTALGMDISASTVVGNVTLTGNGESFIKDASRVEGSIILSGGDIKVSGTDSTDAEVTGSITGATNATLTNATVGNLTASGVVSLTNADTGWIKDAASVSMADASTVTGDITMAETNTGVTMDHSTLQGSIIGAIGATLENASLVTGNLDLAGGAATITASTVQGNVTGAETVTVSAGSTVGNISEVSGKVDIDDSTTGNIATSGDVELTNADSGTISGANVTVTGGSTTGAITSVDSAKVENSEVDGTITAGGLVDLDNATVGNVTSTNGTVDLNGSHAGTISGADVTLTNGSSSGAITATTGAASVTDSTVEGDISAEGVATVTGSTVEGTISGTDVTVTGGSTSGAITASGTAKVENSATGSIDAEAGVTVTGSTVEGTISGTDVSLTDSESGNIEANGDVILSNADTGTISGATSLEMSNGAVVNGDVSMADGNTGVTMDGSTIHGSISNAGKLEITNQSMVTGNVELVGDAELSISDSTVAGTVTGAKSVELTNTSTGDVSVEDKVKLDNADTGSINANSLESINGSTVTGNVTLTGGAADLTDTVVTGSISGASEATLIGSTVGGSVSAKGAVTLDNADTGSINANSLIGRNDSFVTGDVTLTGGSANLTDTVVTGSITGAGEVTLVNAQTGAIAGDSLGAKDSEITGSVTLDGGNAELSNTDVAGDITGAADVTMSAGLVGSIGASGNVSLTEVSSTGTVVAGGSVSLNASQTGSVTGESLTATNASTVSGDVTLAGGDATVTDSIVTGSITGAGKVTVDQSTTGDITGATGDVALSDALVGTVQTAGDLSVDGTVKSDGSVSSDGLSVAEFGSLTAQGDVTADGLITIDGALTSTTGSVSLTGAEGSSISADVTAGKDVTLGGTIAAQDSTVTGENIVVNGTLNAAEGVALNGTVSGLGTINKTGGDDLVLAADTNMSGGAVNVSDGSTLMAEGGHMGSLAVTDGSTLVVGGDSEVATEVKADSLTMDASSTLQSTVNLAAGAADRVTVSGTTDLGGATLVLDGLKSSEEGAVADGTRFTVVQGSLQNSGLAEDVVHDLDKLNAHVENFGDHSDLVLSKNYKGADKTPNQTQVAGALASIDPEAVAGTQLGEVLDALAHTRSEADAKAALDSLGGAGLTAMQKMIADESHEHMQTFRSTFSSLSSGIDRRIDASGSIIPGVNSSAVTVTMTGGVTDVSGDQNIGDYRRSSCGFMLAGAHAVTENWTFGADFAYSAVTGKCTGIDVDADAYFVDLAMRYDNKRFHQMATLGAGFFGFDTKRFVSVKAQGHDFSGIADGSTTAASFNISYEASYDLIVSEDGHHVFSPVVMAEASFAQIKGMTEGGIGNAGLYSEADDVQSLTVGAGARYTFVYGEERNPGFISAEALAMGYAGDDSMTVRNAFIGGGPYFELKGPKAGNAGLRLNLNFLHPLSDKWSVTGNATAEFRSGQSGVGGAIGVKYSF